MLLLRLLPVLPLAVLLGCPTAFDDDSVADDDTGGDDAAAWDAWVLHGPFDGDAVVATVSGADLSITEDRLAFVGSDWVVRALDGEPWIIGRLFNDTVRHYAAGEFGAPTLEFSTGAGTNPQDVALCAEKLWVSRYDMTEDGLAGGDVAIYDAATGGPLGRIDLSPHNVGADPSPEPNGLAVVGGTLYVVLERWDREAGWVPDAHGQLVAIDCEEEVITQAWDLGPNPVLARIPDAGGALLFRTDLGADRFDIDSGTVSTVLENAALGSDTVATGVARVGQAVIYTTEVAWATNEVHCLDLDSGADAVIDSVPQRTWGIQAAPDGRVWVLWRDHWGTPETVEPGGVSIYDAANCARVGETWLSFTSDPASVAFVFEREGS